MIWWVSTRANAPGTSKATMPSDPVMPKANTIHMLIVRAPKNGTQVMIFFILIYLVIPSLFRLVVNWGDLARAITRDEHRCNYRSKEQIWYYSHIAKSLQNAGIAFELVYDLYFVKQFIELNREAWALYTASWLYDTDAPFLFTNVMIVLVPINVLRITNLFVVIWFELVIWFDI